MNKLTVPIALVMVMACACTSLYRSVIGLTAAMDAADDEYAHLYNEGRKNNNPVIISPEVHAKVDKAHLEWRKAAGVAHDALVAHKAGTARDPAAFGLAFEAAQSAAIKFVELILPYTTREKANKIGEAIKGAATL